MTQHKAQDRPALLIVDDEPEVLRSVYDLFRLDYRVLTAERGSEGLRLLQEQEPSVVMSEQRMPEMSGVEFLGRAQAIRPDATRLLFTGYADIRAVIDAINRGNVFRYITKPWDPEELDTIIRQAVEHHDMIVERKRLIRELEEKNERLAEANRLKGAFIEVASHELNTPVAVVLGMTELWKMTQAPEATHTERGWVERIHWAGKRLAATVERMLKLLRSDRFDNPLASQWTELEPLLRGVITGLQPFLVARDQRVEARIDQELGLAEIDPPKIADALTNLIVNAIKFTPDGGRIVVEAGPVGADAVRFRVIDEGVGIGPDECKHLFEPFFTGYDTLHHSSGDFQYCKRGLGLGLCLVKTFVELHGGSIEVETSPGAGSTFSFILPRRLLPTPPALPSAEPLDRLFVVENQ
ncbi:hypothetical protein BH23PLA1_BH23PLA1_18220 [soil metagenome]